MANKLYKVSTAPGFNAGQRRRAGVSLQKGVTQILELTEEQLAALEADVWITVKEADKGDEATTASEGTGEGEAEQGEFDGLKQPELKKIAEAEEVDITGIRSNQGIIDAIEAARAAKAEGNDEEENEDDDETEVDTTVEVTEETPLEDLQAIATALELEGTEDMNAPSLVKAIQDAQNKQS